MSGERKQKSNGKIEVQITEADVSPESVTGTHKARPFAVSDGVTEKGMFYTVCHIFL